jgi:hypothetical protein
MAAPGSADKPGAGAPENESTKWVLPPGMSLGDMRRAVNVVIEWEESPDRLAVDLVMLLHPILNPELSVDEEQKPC